MTKSDFIKYWDSFESVIKQTVNGELCWNAHCEIVQEGESYELWLKSECLVWGSEMAFLSALADRLYVSFVYVPYKESFRVF